MSRKGLPGWGVSTDKLCEIRISFTAMMNPLNRSVLRCTQSLRAVQSVRYFSETAAAVAAEATSKPPRHTIDKEVIDELTIHKAIEKMKSKAWASFDETVEISINTGLDPRKPNQSVKGIAALPFGTGKQVRVCVFASGADAQSAIDAGAEVVGGENLLLQIQSGNINFDTVIATPEMMSVVGKLGKVGVPNFTRKTVLVLIVCTSLLP